MAPPQIRLLGAGVTKESQTTHTSVTSLHKNSPVNKPSPESTAETARQTSIGRRILSRSVGADQYTVRLAASPKDIQAAQSLRFMIFNLELQEGLDASYLTLRDEDAYDVACDHLLVECGGEVVGTYRMQTGEQAARHSGFYSAQEFDLSPFEPIRAEVLELGRACVHSDHRNLRVLSMLWKGIASYARDHGCRYMVGCSSLTSQDAEEGLALYEMLARKHLAAPEFQTLPLPEWVCPLPALEREPAPVPRAPKLLTAYLSLGAKICAPPALDREFKTIDFLTLLDLKKLHASAAELLQ